MIKSWYQISFTVWLDNIKTVAHFISDQCRPLQTDSLAFAVMSCFTWGFLL